MTPDRATSRRSSTRSSPASAISSPADAGARSCSCRPRDRPSPRRSGSCSRRPAPRLAATLISSEVIWGLLAAQGLFLLWRLLAVGSSLLDPSLPRPGRRDALPIVRSCCCHDRAAGVRRVRDRGRPRGGRRDLRRAVAGRGPALVEPEPDPSFLETAPPRPCPRRRRRHPRPRPCRAINGLIIGVDSGVGRSTYLTDTMIVVSLDPVDQDRLAWSRSRATWSTSRSRTGASTAARSTGSSSYARHHPKQFPGADGTGFDVLMGALGTLLGPQDQVLRDGQPRRLRPGRRHPRRRERQRRAGVLRPDLRRVRLRERVLDHGRPPPPQRATRRWPSRASARPSGESDFTRAARQQEVVSGDPRGDRPRRLPERPDRPDQVDRQDGRRRTCRARSCRTWRRPPARSVANRRIARWSPSARRGPATTRAAPSRSRTSRPSASSRRGSSRPTARCCPTKYAQDVDRLGQGQSASASAGMRPAADAEADAEADAQADAQADPTAPTPSADARSRRPPEPTSDPSPTPDPSAGPETGRYVRGRRQDAVRWQDAHDGDGRCVSPRTPDQRPHASSSAPHGRGARDRPGDDGRLRARLAAAVQGRGRRSPSTALLRRLEPDAARHDLPPVEHVQARATSHDVATPA